MFLDNAVMLEGVNTIVQECFWNFNLNLEFTTKRLANGASFRRIEADENRRNVCWNMWQQI